MKMVSPVFKLLSFIKKILSSPSPHRGHLGHQASKNVNKHKARSPIGKSAGGGGGGFLNL
jgi:hypothetical protein